MSMFLVFLVAQKQLIDELMDIRFRPEFRIDALGPGD